MVLKLKVSKFPTKPHHFKLYNKTSLIIDRIQDSLWNKSYV